MMKPTCDIHILKYRLKLRTVHRSVLNGSIYKINEYLKHCKGFNSISLVSLIPKGRNDKKIVASFSIRY